jgi:hypothetical protein
LKLLVKTGAVNPGSIPHVCQANLISMLNEWLSLLYLM